jgi:hypothetical protein
MWAAAKAAQCMAHIPNCAASTSNNRLLGKAVHACCDACACMCAACSVLSVIICMLCLIACMQRAACEAYEVVTHVLTSDTQHW